jgi:creatinine amidohydrolase
MAEKQPWRLGDVTLRDVRKHKYQVAVLPFGATEPHNLHLPYATDTLEVTEVCERACAHAWKKGAKVALLPTIPFGAEQNMLSFPFAISLDQEQLDGIVASVAKSLEGHGVSKLVVVNGHGGNQFQPGLRTLYGRNKSMFCCLINWYEAVAADGGTDVLEHSGNHADEFETSLVMHIAPHLVEMRHADDGATRPSRFDGANKGWVWYPRPWEKLTTNSGVGYPKKATAEKGRKMIEHAEVLMGDFLHQLSQSPRDTFFPFVDKPVKAKPQK